jgi:hypothetical protein
MNFASAVKNFSRTALNKFIEQLSFVIKKKILSNFLPLKNWLRLPLNKRHFYLTPPCFLLFAIFQEKSVHLTDDSITRITNKSSRSPTY